jgi:replicative DNA helicase
MASKDVEQGLLGCLMLDFNCMYQVYDLIRVEMFEGKYSQNVYAKMVECFESGKQFDEQYLEALARTMADDFHTENEYRQFIGDCYVAATSTVMLDNYVGLLVEDYKNRAAHNILKKFVTVKDLKSEHIDKVITQLEELQRGKEVEEDYVPNLFAEYSKIYFTENNKVESDLTTSLEKIDNYLLMIGGDITILGARPSVGKSALAAQIAIANALKGKHVGFFNMEMRKKQVVDRLFSQVSGLRLDRIKRGISLNSEEEVHYRCGSEKMVKLNMNVINNARSILDIKARCRKEKFDLVIIDYLQLIKNDTRTANRTQEVGEISRKLKEISMELNIPFLVLSQLNRGSEYTAEKEPSMTDLRDSGEIEQDASNILLMWKIDDEHRGIKIEKQRDGKLFRECLDYKGEIMTFTESDKTIEDAKAEFKSVSSDDDCCPFG